MKMKEHEQKQYYLAFFKCFSTFNLHFKSCFLRKFKKMLEVWLKENKCAMNRDLRVLRFMHLLLVTIANTLLIIAISKIKVVLLRALKDR